MKRISIASVIMLLSVSLFMPNAYGWQQEYQKSFALSSFAADCEIIVIGRVVQKDYVPRIIDTERGEQATTDVTIDVSEVIKGTPNAGKNKVKVMYLGGKIFDPVEKAWFGEWQSDQPEFEVGEHILLFLNKRTTERYTLWPHGKHTVHRRYHGKKVIVDEEILTMYPNEEHELKPVALSLPLVRKLLKAADKDKERVELLEKDIQDAIKRNISEDITELSDATTDKLSREFQKVIDKAANKETKKAPTTK